MRLLTVLLGLTGLAHAAEDATTVALTRVRQGFFAGPAVVRGSLSFRAPSARVDTRLDAVPALALGGDLWPSPELGLFFSGHIGLGADLGVPGSSVQVGYNLHQIEAGGRYRWFLGPRADAFALLAGLALRGTLQTVQVQRPALLVDRSALGPELQLGFAWPLFGWRLWMQGNAAIGKPFFVREGPTDSGDPQAFFSYGGQLMVVAGLTETFGVQARLDARALDLSFAGEGTRAGGVVDAQEVDRFLTVDLMLRYQF